jgi:hypothetical protein
MGATDLGVTPVASFDTRKIMGLYIFVAYRYLVGNRKLLGFHLQQ